MDTSIVVLDYGVHSRQPNVIGVRHRDLGPTTHSIQKGSNGTFCTAFRRSFSMIHISKPKLPVKAAQ